MANAVRASDDPLDDDEASEQRSVDGVDAEDPRSQDGIPEEAPADELPGEQHSDEPATDEPATDDPEDADTHEPTTAATAAHRSSPPPRGVTDDGRRSAVFMVQAMRRYVWMCFAIVLVTVLVAADVGLLITPDPSATTSIALKAPSEDNVLAPGAVESSSLVRYTAQRAAFVTSDAVLRSVGDAIGEGDLTVLRRRIEVTPSPDSNVISITATGETPELAAQFARQIARSYRSESRKQVVALTDAATRSIEAAVAQAQATTGTGSQDAAAETVAELQLRASNLRTQSALLGDGVDFVVAPRGGAIVDPGLPLREVALGLAVGLLLAAIAAAVRADTEERLVEPVAALPRPVRLAPRFLSVAAVVVALVIGVSLLPRDPSQRVRAVNDERAAGKESASAPPATALDRSDGSGPTPTVLGEVVAAQDESPIPLTRSRSVLATPGWFASLLGLPTTSGKRSTASNPLLRSSLPRPSTGADLGPPSGGGPIAPVPPVTTRPTTPPPTEPPTTLPPPTTEPPTTAPPVTDPPPTTEPPTTEPPTTDPPPPPPDPPADPNQGG